MLYMDSNSLKGTSIQLIGFLLCLNTIKCKLSYLVEFEKAFILQKQLVKKLNMRYVFCMISTCY
jgi:hypothetical protein